MARASVEVVAVDAAYPVSWLQDESRESIADREAQAAFLERWPSVDGTGEAPGGTRRMTNDERLRGGFLGHRKHGTTAVGQREERE